MGQHSAGKRIGHRRPKVDLEAWQSHRSRLSESSRGDRIVALGKGWSGVLHIIVTPLFVAGTRLADVLFCLGTDISVTV